jgi:hypothetical protein
MANTHVKAGTGTTVKNLLKSYETSTAGAGVTVSTPTGRGRLLRVLAVMVSYSAAASTTTTITLNSGLGAAFDNLLGSIVLSTANDGMWQPSEELIISDDDAIDVVAPLLSAETVSIQIITLEM